MEVLFTHTRKYFDVERTKNIFREVEVINAHKTERSTFRLLASDKFNQAWINKWITILKTSSQINRHKIYCPLTFH